MQLHSNPLGYCETRQGVGGPARPKDTMEAVWGKAQTVDLQSSVLAALAPGSSLSAQGHPRLPREPPLLQGGRHGVLRAKA